MGIKLIGEQIWKITGKGDGPVIAVLGGVHGNERTGVEVVKRLSRMLGSETLSVSRGTLFLALGNLEAIAQNTRGSGGERDLNRMFGTERLRQSPDGTYEDRRAREITSLVLDHVDISIDIHSDHKPSVPFLACDNSPQHERIYHWFATDRIVTDPQRLFSDTRVTTDEYVDDRGGIGICFETGYAQDTSKIVEVTESVIAILQDQGLVDGEPSVMASVKKDVYEIVDRVMIDERGFVFAEGMGVSSFQPYRSGEILGYRGTDPVIAKEEGFFIFPKPSEIFWKGTPVVWLARKLNRVQ